MRVTRTHVTDVSFADTTLTPGNARGLAASRTQQTCNVWAHPTLGGRYPGLIKIRQGAGLSGQCSTGGHRFIDY